MQNYFPLIEFTISHDYYTNGRCKDLELVLAQDERKISNNFHLAYRKNNPWQYILYAECNENYEDRIKIFEEEIKDDLGVLSFILIVKEKRFCSITNNVALSSNNQFIDFPIDLANKNNESILCKRKDFPNVSARNSFERELMNKHPNLIAHVTLRISDFSGEFFTTQIKNSNTIKVTFEFEAKSAYWKYIFLPRAHRESEIEISEVNQLVQFSEIEWLKQDEHQRIGISYSSAEIKLSESYPYQIQLWKKYFNGRNLIANHLSFPNPENSANFSSNKNEKNYISIYHYY